MGKPAGKKSAYTFFVQNEKEVWQEEHPGDKIVFGDFMRECGAKWKTLDADTKKPFETKAAADAKRWQEEMADYVPEGGSGKKRKVKVIYNLLRNNLLELFIIIQNMLTPFFLYITAPSKGAENDFHEGP